MLKKFGNLLKARRRCELRAKTIKNITIFGYANTDNKDDLFKEVFDVSKRLAEAGYIVVDGGGPGVMLAASLGAKEGGGKVIGVTLYPKDMKNFEGKDPKNLLDKEIKTDSYIERTLTLMKQGQVYVIFKGGTGTISEFGMAWGLARLYFGHHKPLILYGKFWRKIIKVFKDNMLLRPEELLVYKIVDDPEEVLQAIYDFECEIASGAHDGHLKAS
ncbi:LOG family protein, partial [Candidatus Daviesbacteria bacterium]|nr:LOG family protein [Candidatus Daviesbacteria bacterium]